MKTYLSFSASKNIRQRGAIFFLVLALLSLVTMVAVTMMFVSRLETLASHNAGRSVQARMAAASGVAAALRLLPEQTAQVAALTQPWARGWNNNVLQPKGASVARAAAATPTTASATSAKDEQTSSGVESLALLAALDESSRLNINTVELLPPAKSKGTQFPSAISRETFQRFISSRFQAAGLSSEEGAGVGERILRMRMGSDGKPDPEKVVENTLPQNDRNNNRSLDAEEKPEEKPAPLADLRRKAKDSDDQPIRKIDDLRRMPGMTDRVFQAIAPYVTTYSSSRELWYDEEDKPYVRASLNTSSAEQIYAILSHAYSSASEPLLKQFAVNIVDRRDTDTIPTVYPGSSGGYPTIGAEITPIISETCSDVITLEEDGDNGEYIEIYNALSKAVNLTGWRIEWGNGEYVFNESLPPGGFLILTDDIKNDHDETPEDDAGGMGSFFDVFHMLPSGFQNQATEITGMDIPNESGLIRLYDNHGNIIDYLAYQGGGFNGANRGLQKHSPFAHVGQPAMATPFKIDIEKPTTDYAQACQKMLYARMDMPFSSVAEALTIPAEYMMLTRPTQSQAWTFPTLRDSHGEMLDARLLDYFTIQELPGENRMENEELKPWDPENGPRELGGYPVVSEGSEDLAAPMPKEARYQYEPVSFGKINVNTASEPVLAILPGLDPGLTKQILKVREDAMAEMIRSRSFSGDFAPFRSLSDFALKDELWQNMDDVRRLQSLLFLSPLITFNSCSFRVSAINAADPVKQGKRASQMACQSVVHIDGKGADIITWDFLVPAAPTPDAKAAGQVSSPKRQDPSSALPVRSEASSIPKGPFSDASSSKGNKINSAESKDKAKENTVPEPR